MDDWTRIRSKSHLRRESSELKIFVEFHVEGSYQHPPSIKTAKAEAMHLVDWAASNYCFVEGQQDDRLYIVRVMRDYSIDD